jgi:hypothetical protein
MIVIVGLEWEEMKLSLSCQYSFMSLDDHATINLSTIWSYPHYGITFLRSMLVSDEPVESLSVEWGYHSSSSSSPGKD